MRAWVAAAAALDDPDLKRVCDRDVLYAVGRPSPDFRSQRHVVEVKELTSQPLRRFNGTYEALRRKRESRQNYEPVPSCGPSRWRFRRRPLCMTATSRCQSCLR